MSSATAAESATLPPVLAGLRHQPRAGAVLAGSLAHPVHAYLLVGPSGTGRHEAAIAFSAALLCPNGGCGACPSCRDVLSGRHPDVTVIEREGASISVETARSVVALAQRSPAVGKLQVIVLVDFHLVDRSAPVLLKTLEEPPDSTVFIVLADSVTPELVTIASRCVEAEFVALDVGTVASVLGEEGFASDVAAAAAAAAGGRLDRARLLARDSGFAARQARWHDVPSRLDGTGATVAVIAAELLSSTDELVEVVRARQGEELAAASLAAEQSGERRIPGLKSMEDRHKREQRRVRTDELRAGLGALASAYRTRLVADGSPPRRVAAAAAAIVTIDRAASFLIRNPNEALLLEALLLELDDAP